jgi:endonuclease I
MPSFTQNRLLFRILLPALFLLPIQTAAGMQGSITLSTTQLPDFRQVYTGYFSDVQFYYVTAETLNDHLEITAEAPFRISLDCYEGFAETLTLTTGDGDIPETRIYVRLFPESTGQFQGSIVHESDGTTTATLALSGEGITTTIPDGYYSTATAGGSRLKTQLHQIISNHSVQSYASLWTHFTATDATFDGKVWDIYSNTPCEESPYVYTFGEDQDVGVGGNQEGDVYNREHSMPRSWFGGQVNPMHTDLYHIYPVDKFVNAQRADFPFGMVNNPSWTSMNGGKLGPNVAGGYFGTAFEPIDEYKGDLARAFLYMITRYEDQIETWTYNESGNAMLDHNKYPGYEPWVISMLIDWHRNDPVSQRERLRNQAVYQIQGNRNPFVDHPEFAERIWADTTLSTNPQPDWMGARVFPNPASHHFYLETELEVLQITLFSASGHIVLTKKPVNPQAKININHLPPGLYIVEVQTRKGVVRRKLIKNE